LLGVRAGTLASLAELVAPLAPHEPPAPPTRLVAEEPMPLFDASPPPAQSA
jgi:hypothetical protein